MLVTDAGEELLSAGMAAGFPAGEPNGHHSSTAARAPATYLEVGTRSRDEEITYADVDLHRTTATGGSRSFANPASRTNERVAARSSRRRSTSTAGR